MVFASYKLNIIVLQYSCHQVLQKIILYFSNLVIRCGAVRGSQDTKRRNMFQIVHDCFV